MRIAINGRFLTRRITGVDRYAREITRELDSLVTANEVVVVVPSSDELIEPLSLNNIIVIRFGKHNGHRWEQLEFPQFLKKEHRLGVNLCNTAPMLNPGVVCIHDMAVIANPHNFSWEFRNWYKLMYSVLTRRAKKIVTVSNYSKGEIERYYPIAKGKIEVVSNAWQHMETIQSDDSVLTANSLKGGDYYFAMSSLSPNKNLKWLVETARLNPNSQFAIAGDINIKIFGKHDIPAANNVKYLGYVSDGEAKALMANCKAFLFPTIYEGFGIPPLEAMASGAPAILVSDSKVMHDVYGDSVGYVNPYEPEPAIDQLICERCPGTPDSFDQVLRTYNWLNEAKKLYKIVK
jgi:glycosyltransferase involved in cell wall biosynthesis